MDEPIFKAPNGSAIKGLAQCDESIWPVYWTCDADAKAPGESGDVEYVDDGPSAEWQSVEYEGLGLYVDEAGDAWFAHHLIPDDADPLDERAIEAAKSEVLARNQAASALALAEVLHDGIDKAAVLRLYDRCHSQARAGRAAFVEARGDR